MITPYELIVSHPIVEAVCIKLDPENQIGEPQCFVIEQGGTEMTLTLAMLEDLLSAANQLAQGQDARKAQL